MNKLKVGQRIDVYNTIGNVLNMGDFKAGNTYVGERKNGLTSIFTGNDYTIDGMTSMFVSEIKKVGYFVVKQLKCQEKK